MLCWLGNVIPPYNTVHFSALYTHMNWIFTGFPSWLPLYKLHTLYTHELDFQFDLWLIYRWPPDNSFWNYSNNIDSFDGAAIYECNFKHWFIVGYKCRLCSINSSLQQNKQTNKQTMLICLEMWLSQWLASTLTTSLKGSYARPAWERDPTLQHCTLLYTVQTHTQSWFPSWFLLYKLATLYTHKLDLLLGFHCTDCIHCTHMNWIYNWIFTHIEWV